MPPAPARVTVWRSCVACGTAFLATHAPKTDRDYRFCSIACRLHHNAPAGFPVLTCACGVEFVATPHEAESGRQVWCSPCRGARISAIIAERRKVAA